eukprot:scaffold5041_cov107-Isochrysis_galbana.AAC.3
MRHRCSGRPVPAGAKACRPTGGQQDEGVLVLHGRGDDDLLERPELRVSKDEPRPFGGDFGAAARHH